MSDYRPPSCAHCAKPCTVHLCQIADGQVVKFDLCSDCPKAKAAFEPDGLDIVGKEAPVSPAPARDLAIGRVCPGCGFSALNFKERGRLGCARCYETFQQNLEPILRKVHLGTRHLGKRPQRVAIDPARAAAELDELRERLQVLIEQEDYEEAAAVRDQIRAREN